MRDSDPFWTFVLLAFFCGVIGTILLFGLWEALKLGARILDAIGLGHALTRPRRIDTGRIHR